MNTTKNLLASILVSAALGASASAGTPYCFGDGIANVCPCANNDPTGTGGCLNSTSGVLGPGAVLTVSGTETITPDTTMLTVTGTPPTTAVLFIQGSTQVSPLFGDGLRCVGGSVIRLGVEFASGGTASYPGSGDPVISVKGQIPALGGTFHYQAWYRDAAAFCTAAPFNLSNGMTIAWLP